MKRSALRPYAQVLLRHAGSLEKALELRQELGLVDEAMKEVPRLRDMAANPSIPMERKQKAMEAVAVSLRLSTQAIRFLRLLLEHFRLQQLPELLEVLDEILDRERGIVRARVEAAQAVDPVQRERLQKTLEKVTGGDVDLQVEVNDSLLAGFVARIGSQLYDASLKGQLERLVNRLANA